MIYNGDCLEVLKTLKDNSVDSLVTDPPAGISFMGKDWDHHKGGRKEWIAWLESVMRECIRVMKPGAHGLVWALPRTAHWTATALEDAGFEIRDCITHLFGSGFPKSLDISKAIDKSAGAERVVIGESKRSQQRAASGLEHRPWMDNQEAGKFNITAPASEAAKQWQGFGTALKPAAEFWWLVRKPCSEKTVAANVLKWSTGGLNIDGCRIGTASTRRPTGTNALGIHNDDNWRSKNLVGGSTSGRFPANLVFSHSPNCTEEACDMFECAVEMLDEQSGHLIGAGNTKTRTRHKDSESKFGMGGGAPTVLHDRGGTASRFFYCAKVSPGERNAGLEGMPDRAPTQEYRMGAVEGDPRKPVKCTAAAPVKNHHPTVKAQNLMRYLCKLVTPPGGTVLDPFMGSGSTGLAAKSEGFEFVGIERETEYFQIAQARLKA